MKRYAEARPYLERALAIRKKVLEPTHPDIANSLLGVALLALDEGHPADALPLAQQALAIREKVAPDHPDMMSDLLVLAKIQVAQHHPAAAIPYLERGLAIAAKKEADVDNVAETKLRLAEVLWDTGKDRARSVTLAQEALAAWKEGGAASQEGAADAQKWLDAHKLPR